MSSLKKPCLFSARLVSVRLVSRFLAVAVVLAVAVAWAPSAAAQEVLVQNGATAKVSNHAVFDLQGGTMDFGSVGATARLKEISAGRVAGGTLVAVRNLNNPSSANPAGLGAVLTASVDLGAVVVGRAHEVQTGSGNESIRRYYDIDPSINNSGLSAELTFTYHDAELNGFSEGNLVLFKSTDGGDTWTEEGADSRTTSPTGGNTVTLSGISSFSRWTLGSTSSPLPVELASFEAERSASSGEETVRLTWQTASESGNAGFQVQRAVGSADAKKSRSADWQKVGFVESKAEGGTTSEPKSYQFADEDLPYAADSLSYRLKQVDVGGRAHFSEAVTIARTGADRLQLKETYPNPAQSQVTLRYAVPEEAAGKEVKVRLYDLLGREVRTVQSEAKAGRHETQLSVQNLASGVYILRLEAEGKARTKRLTVVR